MRHPLLLRVSTLALVVLVLGLAGAGTLAPARAADFADSAFLRTWLRTDQPVASGQVARSWYWGPTPGCSVREPYLQAPDGSGTHLVQYFDKSRMEINNPSGDPNSPWYVTNGLLAYEMIAGLVQIGDNDYQTRSPADIVLAGDITDANAPTYHSFQNVTSTPAGQHVSPNAMGQPVVATLDRAGNVGTDPAKVYYPGTTIAYYEIATRHNVPRIFWDFINQNGLVQVGGRLQQGKLSDPATFVTGLPISEAYWARVRINGQPTDVLIQAFQRRVLTYIPAYAAPWNVQMANVGAHYLLWRYGNSPCQANPAPAPTATPVTPPAAAIEPLYRLFSPANAEHFYTVDPNERARLLALGYKDEGSEGRVWNQQVAGSVPFYRLYNRATGAASRHIYTTSPTERDYLLSHGWTIEFAPDGGPGGGYVYNSPPPQTVPLYRWVSKVNNDHIYTTNPTSLGPYGYVSEGVSCYVVRP